MRAYFDSLEKHLTIKKASSQGNSVHEDHRRNKLKFYELPWIRPRSVRAKIISLLMVPIICLMALWAFVTVITVQTASDLTRSQKINADLLAQSRNVVAAAQAERATALSYLAAPSREAHATFISRAKDTDAAIRGGLRVNTLDPRPNAAQRLDHLRKAAGSLTALRARVEASGERQTAGGNRPGPRRGSTVEDATAARWADTYSSYTAVVDQGFSVSELLVAEIENYAVALVPMEILQAREMVSRESLILIVARDKGSMNDQLHREFLASVSTQRFLLNTSAGDLKPTDRDPRTELAYQALRTCEDAVSAAGPRAGCSASRQGWEKTVQPVMTALLGLESQAGVQPQDQKDSLDNEVRSDSEVMIFLGLGGVLLSLLVTVRIGRGLMTDLASLRMTAAELAESSLPRALRRLDAGERVSIDVEAPIQRHGRDEIGQIRSALNALHRGVLHLAFERASLKEAVHRADIAKSVSDVYVSLARRSQPLLQQQFEVLDGLQRSTQDPHMLGELFRLDHLTARMRRHTENLIILSGSTPPRWWSEPVSLLSLLRAALAEVHDYPRVEMHDVPAHYLAGSAVADLSHLIAELLENALTFSPPTTMVRMRAEMLASGLSLKIEDQGLGMSQETMLQANRRVQEPPEDSLTGGGQLGLFVVNRLARRAGVKVRIGNSAQHGVTATVLIPRTLLRTQTRATPASVTPDPPSPSPRPPRPSHPDPLPPPPDPPLQSETASTAGSGGSLPRRVRQTNLVPELLNAPGRPLSPASGLEAGPRSPSAARATIVALQRGWQRGRGAGYPAGFSEDSAPVRPHLAETATPATDLGGSVVSESRREWRGEVPAGQEASTDAAATPPEPLVMRTHENTSGGRTQ
ncbi:ATP-binding protein [Streptomyces sp. NPDC006733]|uniref:sensor histidine kinase n=1 Tax=Streptomyces sp. NPDC006733 TaxID=3155460 RepID=UPI00340C5E9F